MFSCVIVCSKWYILSVLGSGLQLQERSRKRWDWQQMTIACALPKRGISNDSIVSNYRLLKKCLAHLDFRAIAYLKLKFNLHADLRHRLLTVYADKPTGLKKT